MPRHPNYIPHGVIPAVLLPFDNDLAIDEQSFLKHLCDVAAVEGLSAITFNAHARPGMKKVTDFLATLQYPCYIRITA